MTEAAYIRTTPLPDGPVQRRSDSAFIPADLANRDWIEYQEWRALGNEPDPYIPPPLSADPFPIARAPDYQKYIDDLQKQIDDLRGEIDHLKKLPAPKKHRS